jgi:hypothetical protein
VSEGTDSLSLVQDVALDLLLEDMKVLYPQVAKILVQQ